MFLSNFKLSNFKSIHDTPKVFLKEGINIIVGQNNVGKTSILECLSTKVYDNPHISLINKPTRGTKLNGASEIEITFEISKNDFLEILGYYFTDGIDVPINDEENMTTIFPHFESIEEKISINSIWRNESPVHAYPSFLSKHSRYRLDQQIKFVNILYNTELKEFQKNGNTSKNYNHSSWLRLVRLLAEKIYCFKAQRTYKGEGPFGHKTILQNDASNLPEVLNQLQAKSSRFKKFNYYLNQIFPNIYEISVVAKESNQLMILTHTTHPELDREDLAIPLDKCGTGVGQVIALLYVILEAEKRIILIDEPQSFLHPGAIRKLIEIIKENGQHQYIIATHSPIIVSTSNPSTIHLVTQSVQKSTIRPINIEEALEIRDFLVEVGARFSDVFGAEKILWVEGPTEEKCFPLIKKSLGKNDSLGTIVVGVTATGDLDGKHQKTVFDIYNKLSKGSSTLVPPALGFIFDREDRTPTQIADLERQGRGLVKFLKRKMYENYLLNTHAIFDLISTLDEFSSFEVKLEDIIKWVYDNKGDSKYWKGSIEINNWKENIHAGWLLEGLFDYFSNNTIEYRKTKHSILLTEIILKSYPDDLEEIQTLLSSFFDVES